MIPLVASLVAGLALATVPAGAVDTPLPTPVGFVSDFAGVIDAETERSMTALIAELQRRTGAEIAVVTVRSTAPETTFDYAMRLAETWTPGARGKDNGIVFLVAVDDREMFIATGYGIEGALPDGLVGEIRDRDVLPRFRNGDVSGGIRAGVERMAAIIAREYGVTLSPVADTPARPRGAASPRYGLSPGAIVLLMILFFIVLPALLSSFDDRRRRRRRWRRDPFWGGGFGGGGFGGHGGGFGGHGGGFGGFGGGSFGGGGAGGKW